MLDTDFVATHYDMGRGVADRLIEIDSAIPLKWDAVMRDTVQMPLHSGWDGLFQQGTLLLVRLGTMLFTIDPELTEGYSYPIDLWCNFLPSDPSRT